MRCARTSRYTHICIHTYRLLINIYIYCRVQFHVLVSVTVVLASLTGTLILTTRMDAYLWKQLLSSFDLWLMCFQLGVSLLLYYTSPESINNLKKLSEESIFAAILGILAGICVLLYGIGTDI